jgi:predicted N-acetyltransferase YhbS
MDGPRACRTHELAALARAVNAVFRPSGGDLVRELPLLLCPANVDNLRVVVAADGAIAAHAGLCVRQARLAGVTVRVGTLGAVFTRPEDRGHGLASAVVADALAVARGQGVDLALVSGDRNLYLRLGFAPVPPARCWRAPPAAAAPLSPDLTLAAADAAVADDVAALAALHDAEAVRFVRPRADWDALLAAGVVMDGPASLWLVRRRARPIAYLAVRHRASRRVLEHAGDRGAVLAAVPHVADEIAAPWYDDDLAARAARLGWTERALALPAASLWLDAASAARGLPLPWYGLNYV